MTYHKFFCSLLGVLWAVTSVFAAPVLPIDTTSKNKIFPVGNSQIQGAEFFTYIKDGIDFLKQNELAKGINLIATALQQLNSKSKFMRAMPYQSYEMVSILKEVNAGNLSAQEKKLGQMIIKRLFIADSTQTQNVVASDFKNVPNTVFTKRVKVLIYSIQEDKKLTAELKNLLKVAPDLASANTLMAEMCYDNGDYNGCINYSNKTLNALPEYTHAYHMRGKSYSHMRKYDKAIAELDKAIKLSPDVALLIYDRADILLDMERYAEAITIYKKFVPSKFRWAFYNLARSYRGLEKLDSAMYYINEHINQYADDEDGYKIKGDIFSDKNEYDKAISAYTTGLSFAPQNDALLENRGDAYYWSKQYTDALKDYEEALKIESTPYRLDHIGYCYYRFNEYEKSIVFYNKALKLNPEYKDCYWGLNLTYNAMHKYNDAIVAGHKAIAIDSTYDSALGNLGWSYYCAGDYKNCITYSYKALKYEPSAAYAMFNIALATLAGGNFEGAKERYQFFINECRKNNYTISDGAVDDLKELVKNNVMAKEATYIIENIFQ